MPQTASELRAAIAVYESLIETHARSRTRMLERRKGAADHIMVELDQRLAANERTLEALRRTVEVTRELLKITPE